MSETISNVVQMFVPRTLDGLVPQIIERLRSDTDRGVNWFTAQRILPVPDDLPWTLPNAVDRLISADPILSHLPIDIFERTGIKPYVEEPEIPDGVEKETQEAVRKAMADIARTGHPDIARWRMRNWGTTWTTCDEPPEIVADPDPWYDEDAVMIRWIVDSKNTTPDGIAKTLGAACAAYGFGLRWSAAGNEESVWNPLTDRHESIWTPLAVRGDATEIHSEEPASMTDALLLHADGIDFTRYRP